MTSPEGQGSPSRALLPTARLNGSKPSPFARHALLRAESLRLRQSLSDSAAETWTDWRASHGAEIGAFSWGLRQGRRLTDGWRRMMSGEDPKVLALPALAVGWWLVRRRRTVPKDIPAPGHDLPSTLDRTVGVAGAVLLLSRLSRAVRWARWLHWGWTVYRRWPQTVSRASAPQASSEATTHALPETARPARGDSQKD